MAAEVKEDQESGKRVIYTYPMVKQTDMSDDMKAEVMEMCVNACEKHTTNNENAAKVRFLKIYIYHVSSTFLVLLF